MNQTNKTTVLAAGLVLALSGAAFAQSEPPVQDPLMDAPPAAEVTFDQLDKDADGFVAKSDVPAEHALALQFAQADTDQDSRLSRTEFEAFENPVEEEEAEE